MKSGDSRDEAREGPAAWLAALLAGAALIPSTIAAQQWLPQSVLVVLMFLGTLSALVGGTCFLYASRAQYRAMFAAALDLRRSSEPGRRPRRASAWSDSSHEAARQMAAGREDLLDEVERIWIKGELDRSLDRLVRIELDLVARPDAVELPMGMLLRRGGQQDVPLGRGRSMVTVFEELGRRLLILGDPGAGKTTLLLELTQGLLEQARSSSSEPMPVVFQLSSWAADRRPLAEWMVGELHRTYGVPRPLGWAWIDGNAIIPALDGLDEVPERERESCVDAINHFRVDHGQQPIVVCTRTEEYERLHNQLQLRNAVVIQPLDRTEVSTYLQNAGPKLAGLRTLLRHDRRLWDLLTTPLLLTFTVLSYRDRRPRARHDQESPEGLDSRRDQLLADYVDSRLYTAPKQPAPGPYLAEQMIRWLGWLGQGMRARNQSIFYIDGLQPDWLPNRYQQRMSAFGAAFITALVTWLSTAPLLPLGYDLELRGFFARLTYPTRLAVGFGVVLLPAAALIAWLIRALGLRPAARVALGLAAGVAIGIGPLLFPGVGPPTSTGVETEIVVLTCLCPWLSALPSSGPSRWLFALMPSGQYVFLAAFFAQTGSFSAAIVCTAMLLITTSITVMRPSTWLRLLLALSVGPVIAFGIGIWSGMDVNITSAPLALLCGATAGVLCALAMETSLPIAARLSAAIVSGGGFALLLWRLRPTGAVGYAVVDDLLVLALLLTVSLLVPHAARQLRLNGRTRSTVVVACSVTTAQIVFWISDLSIEAMLLPLGAAVVVGASVYGRRVLPAQDLHWSWTMLRRRLVTSVRAGLVAGAMLGAMLVTADILNHAAGDVVVGNTASLLSLVMRQYNLSLLGGALILGLAGGVALGLVGGFDNRLVVRPPTPGAGIAACGRNAMVGGAATGAVTLLIGALAVFGYDTLILPLIATRAPRLLSYLTDVSGFSAELWVLISLVLVLMVAMRLGGASYIRHQLIRRLLVQAGATPADYQAFLDHASRLNLLRRRGGGYQFIHRLLLEHFANRAPAP